ncbi:hypothetical protein LSO2F_20042 [Candidatus Liberibacter solanacearum]
MSKIIEKFDKINNIILNLQSIRIEIKPQYSQENKQIYQLLIKSVASSSAQSALSSAISSLTIQPKW